MENNVFDAGFARRVGWKRTLVNILLTLVFAAVYYYAALPALNPHAPELYRYLILVLVVFIVLTLLSSGLAAVLMSGREAVNAIRRNCLVPVIAVGVLLAAALIGTVVGSVLFRADAYSRLLVPEPGDFASEVEQISFDQIPMLDSDSANVLATRKLGELSDLVSQFEVSNTSVQINYQDRPVRVTYLDYGDFFKWWNNRASGIPAYLVTDMVTQEVTVVRLGEGMRYSPSELFGRDLMRHLRFSYPTKMFTDVNFEIDEDGRPWWVASVSTRTIGLFGGEDIVGAVLCDAVTGQTIYCDVADVPTWCDRVYDADLIIEQYDYYGRYHNGFWNSLFGQTDCTVTTSGYNYIAQGDDVWLYTGITSVSGDQGNIGFILVNQRTRQASFYSCAGAEEHSAMDSAQGAVQQYAYRATFPLLLNIGGQPTYFMALKDNSSLVKQYAMVNVQQYQIVATGATVAQCEQNYLSLLRENGVSAEVAGGVSAEPETVSGTLTDIRTAVLDGTTYYYLRLDGKGDFYRVSAAECEAVVTLDVGMHVTVTVSGEGAGGIVPAGSAAAD